MEHLQGLILTPLRVIEGDAGDVLHGMKSDAPGYAGFGEAYFSTVACGCVKGWKRHREMVLNLIVPVGLIKFVMYDPRDSSKTSGCIQEVLLGRDVNYSRLTVPSGLWMAFQGCSAGLNMLMNFASIPHDPTEADVLPLNNELISYDDWKL